ncbi:MAG TPA: response regulator [Acetobacteraceae bacterium]|jgi:FixJ family two-component response regulator|nr:response regulator [Acetobacteraceae bacterium]
MAGRLVRSISVPTMPLIAIVDDDESVRLALQGFIRSIGLAAQVFDSAADFLASANTSHVHCLILDVNMPGMSGLALHRQLVTSGQAIPTVLITANPDDATRAEALRQGALCYLCKPFADNDLLACINIALGRAGPAGAKPP